VQLVGGVGLPPIATHADLTRAMNVIMVAAMQGGITPDEAFALSKMVDSFHRTLEAGWVERVRLWRGRLLRMWAGKETRRVCWGVG
jgi:hypothetical protein